MPLRISFLATKEQMYAGTKTVTRREGWKNLKSGQILTAVEKGMGLKPGEKHKIIYDIEILETRWEPLDAITPEDVVREGFPGWTTEQFIELYLRMHKGKKRGDLVNRIVFRKVS